MTAPLFPRPWRLRGETWPSRPHGSPRPPPSAPRSRPFDSRPFAFIRGSPFPCQAHPSLSAPPTPPRPRFPSPSVQFRGFRGGFAFPAPAVANRKPLGSSLEISVFIVGRTAQGGVVQAEVRQRSRRGCRRSPGVWRRERLSLETQPSFHGHF